MGRIPYQGNTTVSLNSNFTPYQSVQASPDAFGAQVGEATQNLGKAVDTVKDVVYTEQEKMAETKAMEWMASVYSPAMDNIELPYLETMGHNAVSGAQTTQQALRETSQKLLSQVTDPWVRKKLETGILKDSEARIGGVMRHSQQQQTVYTKGVWQGKVAMDRQALAKHPLSDPAGYYQRLGIAKATISKFGFDFEGKPREQIISDLNDLEYQAGEDLVNRIFQSDPSQIEGLVNTYKPMLPRQLQESLDYKTRPIVEARQDYDVSLQLAGMASGKPNGIGGLPKTPSVSFMGTATPPPMSTEGYNFGRVHSAMIHIETGGTYSDYDKNGNVLTSPTGAKGSRQVLDSTARDPGFGVKGMKDASLAERARVGDDYLVQMMSRYENHAGLALLAYNQGAGNVDKWIKKIGDPRKGEVSLTDFISKVPKAEGRNYMRKFYNLMQATAGDENATFNAQNGINPQQSSVMYRPEAQREIIQSNALEYGRRMGLSQTRTQGLITSATAIFNQQQKVFKEDETIAKAQLGSAIVIGNVKSYNELKPEQREAYNSLSDTVKFEIDKMMVSNRDGESGVKKGTPEQKANFIRYNAMFSSPDPAVREKAASTDYEALFNSQALTDTDTKELQNKAGVINKKEDGSGGTPEQIAYQDTLLQAFETDSPILNQIDLLEELNAGKITRDWYNKVGMPKQGARLRERQTRARQEEKDAETLTRSDAKEAKADARYDKAQERQTAQDVKKNAEDREKEIVAYLSNAGRTQGWLRVNDIKSEDDVALFESLSNQGKQSVIAGFGAIQQDEASKRDIATEPRFQTKYELTSRAMKDPMSVDPIVVSRMVQQGFLETGADKEIGDIIEKGIKESRETNKNNTELTAPSNLVKIAGDAMVIYQGRIGSQLKMSDTEYHEVNGMFLTLISDYINTHQTNPDAKAINDIAVEVSKLRTGESIAYKAIPRDFIWGKQKDDPQISNAGIVSLWKGTTPQEQGAYSEREAERIRLDSRYKQGTGIIPYNYPSFDDQVKQPYPLPTFAPPF